MKRKLENGYESVWYLERFADALSPAYVKLDERGATVTLPLLGSNGRALLEVPRQRQ